MRCCCPSIRVVALAISGVLIAGVGVVGTVALVVVVGTAAVL